MKVLPVIFGYNDLKDYYHNHNGFYSFLKRALKNGSIKQIKKGLYALVDPSTGNLYANKFQIACKLFDDSYFSYHEALEYYGLVNQSFVSTFTYITHTNVNPVSFNGIIFNSKISNYNLDIVDTTKENGIRVVSLERALIDSIDNYYLGGGLEEVEYALDACKNIDIDRIQVLLKHYNKSILFQKVGYLFEKHFADEIPNSFYDFCLSNIGNKKTYLNCKPGKTKLVKKWNVLIPSNGVLPNEFLNSIF